MSTLLIKNRFELKELIGSGGLGNVYKGHDTVTHHPVAIKILKPEVVLRQPDLIERFQREGYMLRQLDHPNIVKVIEAGSENGQHYIVMEFLEGGTLSRVMAHQQPLPIGRVLEIALDLADALTRAHRLNIIHRDIKPDNVLFSEGVPHLTDFGIAHFSSATRITQVGTVMGSYHYLSPEACNGKEIDARTDIWSFGVLLYEMLTGYAPFHGDNPGTIINQILHKPIPDPTQYRNDIPAALVNLLNRMLEKDRDQRIPSMRQVGAELEAAIRNAHTPIPLTPGSLLEKLIQSPFSRFATTSLTPVTPIKSVTSTTVPAETIVFRQRKIPRWAWMGILLFLVLTIAGLGFFLTRDHEKSDPTAAPSIAMVEPVTPGKYMVLVADLKPINTEPREVDQFILDDLTENLERSIPYFDLQVRDYPGVITSAAQAQAVAEKNDAAIIIWGNYTDDLVILDIQLGSLAQFPYIAVDRQMLDDSLNIRVQVEDVLRESVASYVISDFLVLYSANGEAFSAGEGILSLGEARVTPAEVVGSGLAVQFHWFFSELYLEDEPETAMESINRAIGLSPDNPMLYHFRSLGHQRLGDFANADQDLETASRLADGNWYVALILRASVQVLSRDYEMGIDALNIALEKNPNDWFISYMRGVLYQLTGEFKKARADFEAAIAKGPDANLPYLSLIQIALREGEIEQSVAYTNTILHEFTDPHWAYRTTATMYGGAGRNNQFYTSTMAAYGSFMVGQFEETIRLADIALEIEPDYVDLLMLKGISLCSTEQYEEAEEVYTQAIELEPEFILLYLLRAEVRNEQRNLRGALEDFNTARESPIAEKLEPYIESGMAGEASCKDFLSE